MLTECLVGKYKFYDVHGIRFDLDPGQDMDLKTKYKSTICEEVG